MQKAQTIVNFKNENTLKEALNQGQAATLIEKVTDVKSALSVRNAVKSLEKKTASELLKSKSNPEKWLDLYKTHQTLEQKIIDFGGKPANQTKEQVLFDTILFDAIKGVLHEQLDLDPEVDGIDLTQILDKMDTPEEFFDTEIEKESDFKESIDQLSSKEISRVHDRLASLLKKYNNAYTLKRVDYKLEKVKVPTVSFLGKCIFPVLGNSVQWKKEKLPCAKGRGDWIDVPTSFILARTNDILQETKGRLAVYADERKVSENSYLRLKSFFAWIKAFFKKA